MVPARRIRLPLPRKPLRQSAGIGGNDRNGQMPGDGALDPRRGGGCRMIIGRRQHDDAIRRVAIERSFHAEEHAAPVERFDRRIVARHLALGVGAEFGSARRKRDGTGHDGEGAQKGRKEFIGNWNELRIVPLRLIEDLQDS